MKLDFKGKAAVITGASGGMGLEISKKLSQNNIHAKNAHLIAAPSNKKKKLTPFLSAKKIMKRNTLIKIQN